MRWYPVFGKLLKPEREFQGWKPLSLIGMTLKKHECYTSAKITLKSIPATQQAKWRSRLIDYNDNLCFFILHRQRNTLPTITSSKACETVAKVNLKIKNLLIIIRIRIKSRKLVFPCRLINLLLPYSPFSNSSLKWYSIFTTFSRVRRKPNSVS